MNLEALLTKIFFIDGRLYKHYRLISWFPKYLEAYVKTQILLMDNNDGGDEDQMNHSENDIFPKYVNYYLAIMAVSCY